MFENENLESVDVYFERDSYSFDELDEMFVVIENHSSSTIEFSPMYAIERHEDEEWVNQTNHDFHQMDHIISISPDESKAFSVWLSINSVEFEKGLYRLFTKIDYEDVYLAFEIN